MCGDVLVAVAVSGCYTFLKYTLNVKMTICINKMYGEFGR